MHMPRGRRPLLGGGGAMQCIRGQAGGWSRDSMRRARASEPSYFSVNTLDLLNCTRAHVRAREARNLRRWLTPVRGAGRWIRTHLAHAHHGIAKASCPDPAVIPPIGVGACLDQCHQFVRVRVAVCLPHERSSTRPGPELERRNFARVWPQACVCSHELSGLGQQYCRLPGARTSSVQQAGDSQRARGAR